MTDYLSNNNSSRGFLLNPEASCLWGTNRKLGGDSYRLCPRFTACGGSLPSILTAHSSTLIARLS